MSNKVTVYNMNIHPLHEMFKGEEILIEPQDYWRDKKGNIKELDIYEANDFRGQYHPVPFDGSGKMINDPKHFKMLKMDPVDKMETSDDEDDAPAFKCMAKECKHVSPSSEELDAHIKVRHPAAEKLVMPEIDREIKKKKKAS